MRQIAGKRAVVTGGTRGIGLAIVNSLLARDARVFLCSRSGEDVERTVLELQKDFGERVCGWACDIGNYESVKVMMGQAVTAMGGMDVLVNNAGVGLFKPFVDLTEKDWQVTVATNLSGAFYCCAEAVPVLKAAGGGFIINIGSLAGRHPFAGGTAYCASKAGLIGFSEALMHEVRLDGIRVSLVLPGSVNTDFSRSGKQVQGETWKLWPEDVAEVVIHLLECEDRALPSLVELRPSQPR